MLPTSTNLSVQIEEGLPSGSAVALLLTDKPRSLPREAGALDGPARSAAERVLGSGLFRGKACEVAVAIADSAGRSAPRPVLLIGLGPAAKLSSEVLRQVGGALARAMRRYRLDAAALMLPIELPEAVSSASAVEALTTGLLLASFRYDEYKGVVTRRKRSEEESDTVRQRRVTLVAGQGARALRPALERARSIAEGQNFARTIAWRPGNDINPPALAKVAQQLAKEVGLGCRILDEKEMARLKMGGILAVGAGSNATPPRMIILHYRPGRVKRARTRARSGEPARPPLLVVGKAITFDTGGISIKPAEKMGRMIFDKCGGMTVLGLMYAVARLKPAVPVVGILSSAENHISETAYRPGDVLRMYNGVTVEVTNTDAEGRLVLADALAWGIETYRPAAVIDLATLTGGVVVALGRTMAGMMSNNDELVAELQRAADRAGEKFWRLPLGDEQREQLRSEPADIVNSAGRDAHPLQGGAFLSHFVPENTPWAHLDIAGVADTDKDLPYYSKGATGWGVRTLVEWVTARQK